LKSLLKESSNHIHNIEKEVVDTLDDGSVIIKKFKTIVVGE
jgi:hypothetical protein